MTEDWLQLYAPKTLNDLNIQKAKINELQLWLKNAFGKVYVPPILILHGPPGSGKNTAIHLTASVEDAAIIEWITPVDIYSSEDGSWVKPEAQVCKFERFIFYTARYNSILQDGNHIKRLILVREYPNAFLLNPALLQDIIRNYVTWGRIPLVFSCSEQQTEKGLFPISFCRELKISQITLRKATSNSLLTTLRRIASFNNMKQDSFPHHILGQIVKNANGDIKNAVLQLQYELAIIQNKAPKSNSDEVEDFSLPWYKVKRTETDTSWTQFADFKVFSSKTKIPPELKKTTTTEAKQNIRPARKLKSSKASFSRRNKKQEIAEDNTEQSENSKVCGKDLRLPIFQNVGRILYPKRSDQSPLEKNCNDSADSKDSLLHSPEEIVEQTLGHHEIVIQMAFENYLKTFRDIQDVSQVITYVSDGDTVLKEFRERELGSRIAMTIITRSLMLCNRDVIRKWNPLTTKEFSATRENLIKFQNKLKVIYPQYATMQQTTVMDILPLSCGLLQTKETGKIANMENDNLYISGNDSDDSKVD